MYELSRCLAWISASSVLQNKKAFLCNGWKAQIRLGLKQRKEMPFFFLLSPQFF